MAKTGDPAKLLASAVRILRMIAEMPMATHEMDRALCCEWLEENGYRSTDREGSEHG